jgi:glycosyltransferase involved in cell wall biosynthesis
MYQYAQAILVALSHLPKDGNEVVPVYGDARWRELIERAGLTGFQLNHWRAGEFIANVFMATSIPTRACRLLSKLINPLTKELHRHSCDIWIFPAQDPLSWQIQGAVVSTVHDLMHKYERHFPEAGAFLRYYARQVRFRHLSRDCAAILVDSEIGRQHVVDSYQAECERVHVLPYIAPTHKPPEASAISKEPKYSLPEKYYFYPAQFWPHKNHLRLIEALAQARLVHGDIHLVLTGRQAHDFHRVAALVEQLGLRKFVHFLGYVPDGDLAELYRGARALVMPTFFGPTNIPPLEAMANSCPIIISDIYGHREQCRDSALYFDPTSVEELAQLMSSLWANDQQHRVLMDAGRRLSLQRGPEHFSTKLREILYSVA